MAPAQTRRAWREVEKKKSGMRWGAVGAVAFIVVGGGGLLLVTQSDGDSVRVPSTCETTQRVSVVTDQAMADVLRKKPVDGRSCIQLDVKVEGNAETALRASAGELTQPLWIPDSTHRLPQDMYDSQVSVHTDSLALSPGVVVGQDRGGSSPSWSEALSDDAVRMGDPDRDAGAHSALLGVAAEIGEHDVSPTDASDTLTSRAQTQGVDSPILSAPGMLDEVVNAGGRAVVAEHDYLSYLDIHRDAALEATVPETGTAFLDYPLLASGNALENNEAVRNAADEITAWIDSHEGQSALGDANLRLRDGEIDNDSAVDASPRLPRPDEEDWETLVENYRVHATPLNALVVVDASGSMGTEENGRTRWEATMDTFAEGAELFPSRDAMGVWLFSDDLGPDDTAHTELVPVRGMEEDVNGSTQREVLREALADADYKEGGQTRLHETALEAFRSQQENYQEGQVNMVLLVSDGKQEVYTEEDYLSLERLVEDLRTEQDPERPVVIMSVGISPDADEQALTAIAEATGGRYHEATTPEEFQTAFTDAVLVDPGGDNENADDES